MQEFIDNTCNIISLLQMRAQVLPGGGDVNIKGVKGRQALIKSKLQRAVTLTYTTFLYDIYQRQKPIFLYFQYFFCFCFATQKHSCYCYYLLCIAESLAFECTSLVFLKIAIYSIIINVERHVMGKALIPHQIFKLVSCSTKKICFLSYKV